MTDRRPDINCDGCDTYVRSLPHLATVDDFPERPVYCEPCDEAVGEGRKTPKMQNLEWYRITNSRIDGTSNLSLGDISDLRAFAWTSYFHGDNPEERVYDSGEVEEMTADEWAEISELKLVGFKKHCNKDRLRRLEDFISA